MSPQLQVALPAAPAASKGGRFLGGGERRGSEEAVHGGLHVAQDGQGSRVHLTPYDTALFVRNPEFQADTLPKCDCPDALTPWR